MEECRNLLSTYPCPVLSVFHVKLNNYQHSEETHLVSQKKVYPSFIHILAQFWLLKWGGGQRIYKGSTNTYIYHIFKVQRNTYQQAATGISVLHYYEHRILIQPSKCNLTTLYEKILHTP